MIQLDLYNQWDPSWGAKKLGNAQLPDGRDVTMANSGCYLTTIAMILSNYGIKITPGDLCDTLNAIDGFIEGMVKWDAVEAIFPWVKWYESQWTTQYTKAKDIAKVEQLTALSHIQHLVSLGFPVLLCVDHIGNDLIPDHAVALKEAPADLKAWKIHDPDGGMNISFLDRYGNPSQGVYGYRTILGAPTSFPESSTDFMKGAGTAAWKLSQMQKAYDKIPSSQRESLPAEIRTYVRETLDDLLR